MHDYNHEEYYYLRKNMRNKHLNMLQNLDDHINTNITMMMQQWRSRDDVCQTINGNQKVVYVSMHLIFF